MDPSLPSPRQLDTLTRKTTADPHPGFSIYGDRRNPG